MAVDNRIAIPELGSENRLNWNARQLLDRIFSEHAHVIRRPAGDDHDAADFLNCLAAKDEVSKVDAPVFDARGNRAAQRLGLFHDFLEHEVRVTALFRRGNFPVNVVVLLFDRQLHRVIDLNRVARQNGDLAVFHVRNVSCVLDERRHVGGDEVAAVAVAKQQRRVLSRRIQPLRIVCADDAEGVRTLDAVQHHVDRVLHAVHLVEPQTIFQQLRDDLAVRFRGKLYALLLEKFPDLQIIFNDPVVYQRDLAVLGHMGVGVDIVRFAVRCPAGVADADRAVHECAVRRLFGQVCEPALAFGDVQHAVLRHADTRRVIAPVLQPRKALEQNGRGLLLADITYDSTHKIVPPENKFRTNRRYLPASCSRPLCFAVTRIFLTASRAQGSTETHPPNFRSRFPSLSCQPAGTGAF